MLARASSPLTSSLFGQKPDKHPYAFEPLEFDAGLVCRFPVLIEGSGNQSEIFGLVLARRAGPAE